MKPTMTLSANLNTNPFVIYEQDIDEVIMTINFYIELGAEQKASPATNKTQKGKQERIRVNDETATGGWF
jgi:hypothetical protein